MIQKCVYTFPQLLCNDFTVFTTFTWLNTSVNIKLRVVWGKKWMNPQLSSKSFAEARLFLKQIVRDVMFALSFSLIAFQ